MPPVVGKKARAKGEAKGERGKRNRKGEREKARRGGQEEKAERGRKAEKEERKGGEEERGERRERRERGREKGTPPTRARTAPTTRTNTVPSEPLPNSTRVGGHQSRARSPRGGARAGVGARAPPRGPGREGGEFWKGRNVRRHAKSVCVCVVRYTAEARKKTRKQSVGLWVFALSDKQRSRGL